MRRRLALAAPLALAGAWATHPGLAAAAAPRAHAATGATAASGPTGPTGAAGATPAPTRGPSQTALGAAMHRAAHRLLERPLVFDDPLALPILGLERVRWLAANLDRFRSPAAGSLRAALVVRSRVAEDTLAQAVVRGTRQAVILGAGLDTFGCRNPHARLQVFEVDLPATQAWKRERLAEQGIAVPRSLAFVPVDFETQTLAARLHAAGLRTGAPALFSWLGVTMYLSRDAIAQTLRFAGACAPGSQIVFDYLPAAGMLPEAERRARAQLAARVAAAGEPWLSEFEPAELAALLRAQGFSRIVDLDADALDARYFAGRDDAFRIGGTARLMIASV
jgi:methyltransferase (TIGR00027 family)